MIYHVSPPCLIMSHQVWSHHVSSCLIISHINVYSSCHRISSHLNVSHHILCGFVLSHPFNRIPSNSIISHVLPSHHLPSFSTVIPLLQLSEIPLPHCIAFVHPPGPQVMECLDVVGALPCHAGEAEVGRPGETKKIQYQKVIKSQNHILGPECSGKRYEHLDWFGTNVDVLRKFGLWVHCWLTT